MRILILSAHVDDAELGMGGTIAKLVAEDKHMLKLVAFSSADDSLPPSFAHGTLRHEIKEAARRLGMDVNRDPPTVLHFETRYFPRDRQEILEELVRIREKYKPDVVYCPNYDDLHQDHMTLAKETMRAFKYRTILMYQMPWNSREIKLQYFSVLDHNHLKTKISALKCFTSQRGKTYMHDSSIVAVVSFYGQAIGKTYAEAFEVVRFIDD